MFLFLRLVLAHYIGDFLLQTNRIFAMKVKGLKGIFLHVVLVTICFTLMAWPYYPYLILWIFLVFNALEHILQDHLKILISKNEHYRLPSYIIDQVFHILTIAIIFFTPMKNFAPPETGHNILVHLYNDDHFILMLIAVIFASYNGHYLLELFRKDFCHYKKNSTAFEKSYGIIERAFVVSFLLVDPTFVIWTIPIILLRPSVAFFWGKRLQINTYFGSLRETIFSAAISLSTGFCAMYLIQLL